MKKWRKIWVLAMALVYAGQALAVSLPACDSMSHGDSAPAAAHAGEHAGHAMPGHGASDDATDLHDCCGDSLCGMSQCQTAFALPVGDTEPGVHQIDLFLPSSDAGQAPRPLYALYRPPISH